MCMCVADEGRSGSRRRLDDVTDGQLEVESTLRKHRFPGYIHVNYRYTSVGNAAHFGMAKKAKVNTKEAKVDTAEAKGKKAKASADDLLQDLALNIGGSSASAARKQTLIDMVRLGAVETFLKEEKKRKDEQQPVRESPLMALYKSTPAEPHDTVLKYFNPEDGGHSALKEKLLCEAAKYGHWMTIRHLIDEFKAGASLVSQHKTDTQHGKPANGKRCDALDLAYEVQERGMKVRRTIKELEKAWKKVTKLAYEKTDHMTRFKTLPFQLSFTFGELEILLGKSDQEEEGDLPKDVKNALERLKYRGYLQDEDE